MTSSNNEPVDLRSTQWVRCSLKQPSLLNDASTRPPLLFNPRARANLKCKDNALTHSLLRGGHTTLNAHWKTHTDYSSLTVPQCSQTFMSVDFYIFSPHCGCSVSSERFSRCWQSVTPMFTGTSSVLFLLCLVSLCFSCHVIFFFPLVLSHDLFKETT